MNFKKIFFILSLLCFFGIADSALADSCCYYFHLNGVDKKSYCLDNVTKEECELTSETNKFINNKKCSTLPECPQYIIPTVKDSADAAGCKFDLKTGQEVCTLENPIGIGQKGTVDATAIISTAIKGALGIVGALTLLMLVWGGFEWLTSAGNPEKVKAGTQTMVWAVIGVVLVFASYLLLSTFTTYLTAGGN